MDRTASCLPSLHAGVIAVLFDLDSKTQHGTINILDKYTPHIELNGYMNTIYMGWTTEI